LQLMKVVYNIPDIRKSIPPPLGAVDEAGELNLDS